MMSSRADQTREEGGGSRIFTREPGEGEALWWFGVLATIKATAEQTDGQYALVEILAPDGYEGVLHVHHFEDEGDRPQRQPAHPPQRHRSVHGG
jgi:hypothetical protein